MGKAGRVMMRYMHKHSAACVAVALSVVSSAHADMTIDVSNRGHYRVDGATSSPVVLGSTLTGTANGSVHRSYFAFDLSGLGAQVVTSATLRLEVEHWFAGSATESFNVYAVSTDVADVIGGGNSVPVFTDLGSGDVYGTGSASSADVGQVVEISLDAGAMAAIMAASGGLFAVGIDLATIDGTVYPSTDFEALRFSSGSEARTHQLFVETVPIPAPSAMLLALIGFPMASWARRRLA